MCMLNLESECSWSLTNDKLSRSHSARSQGWCVLIAGMWCTTNPFGSACMHNYRLSHRRGRFCQTWREKNRYFSTAFRIQDGRLHVGREKIAPFVPYMLCSLAPSGASLFFPLRFIRCGTHARAYTRHTHAYARARVCGAMYFLSCRYLQLLTLLCVAMLILTAGNKFD